MTRHHSQLSTSFLSAFLAGLTLLLTGCASTGFFGEAPRVAAASPANIEDTTVKVQNLPKSRLGNMEQYTVFGKNYRVMDSAANFTEQGTASWYGKKFHGRKTSSGEVYDMQLMTAAHKHLPLPTFVRVTNLENNLSVVVKVNDRGPFIGDRIIDMSFAAATELGMVERGTASVRVDALSTHLVAENPIESNVDVAKSFSTETPAADKVQLGAALPAQEPLAGAELGPDTVALEAPAEPAANELGPNTIAQVAQVDIDVSEDGYTDLPAVGAASLAGAEVESLVEPSEVASLMEEPKSLRKPIRVPSGENIYIQIGAFSQSANAHAMVDNVDEKTGLPAYVEKDNQRRLFRVKIGPFQQGDLLESTIDSLENIGIESYTKLAAQN